MGTQPAEAPPLTEAPQAPPNMEVVLLTSALVTSRALWLVAELGIADHVSQEPVGVDVLARSTGTHEDTLYRLLRHLAAKGVFQEHAGRRFSHTPRSETLRSDHPTQARAGVRLLGGPEFWTSFGALDRSARTGQTGWSLSMGQPFFEWLAAHPERAAIFNDAMVGIHGGEPPAVAEAYPFSGTVVDVGGGSGNLLVHVLQRHPASRGILFDLPHVESAARARLVEAGVAERCELVTGSFFEALPAGGDAYVLSHIIHDWDEASCVRILENCRRAKREGGRVLLVEAVIPGPNVPHLATLLDLVMLMLPGGRERTEAEYAALFAKAGLRLTRVVPTASPMSILEAV